MRKSTNKWWLFKHGKSGAKIYSVWRGMKDRCYNKKNKQYKDYGGRGILVCKSWINFNSFYRDMGDIPKNCSIDRINNDGPYSKANCRWATRKEQNRNTRRNRFHIYNGKRLTLIEISERFGVEYGALQLRTYRDGMSIRKALNHIKNRKQNTHIFRYKNKKHTIPELAKRININEAILRQRLIDKCLPINIAIKNISYKTGKPLRPYYNRNKS